MGKSWKIAVIGTGDMGNQHVSNWQKAGHEVVSVTDIDLARATEMAEKYGVQQVYKDYKEACDDPDVKIISISLPLTLHAPVTIYAAQRGKHIFCEKPLSRNFQEADAMEQAVRKAGVQFALGLQRNLTKAMYVARDLIQEGRLGHPIVSQSDSLMEIRPKRVMHDANGNGGPIMDTGCHYFMMWQTIYQSVPKKIYANGRVLASDRPELAHIEKLAWDTAAITIEYESGDIAIFTVNWGAPPKFKMRGYPDRLYGPKGGISGNLNSNNKTFMLYEEDQATEISVDVYDSLHRAQFELFANALNEGKPAPISFQEGRDMLATTLAIFESIETGQVIDYAEFYKKISQHI